jgi:hypothetical protein
MRADERHPESAIANIVFGRPLQQGDCIAPSLLVGVAPRLA